MFFHPRGSSQTGLCLWGSHSGVNNRQEGEKTKHNHRRQGIWPPKTEKGLEGGGLLIMQALGDKAGGRSWAQMVEGLDAESENLGSIPKVRGARGDSD